MATAHLMRTQLRIIFEDGVHPETGDPVFKRKSFNNVNGDATADQLYAVGNALVSLQQLPLHGFERSDLSEISSD